MRIQIAVFNHLLNQQPAVRAELAAHVGRRVGIVLAPLTVRGVITDEGWLAACAGEPEATIRLQHAAALAAVSGRDPALSDVSLEGDTELAAAIGRLIARLRWDAGEDLSRVMGDVAANRLQRVARASLGFKGEIAWRLLENWVEHLREEAPMLASRQAVASYLRAVDSLRDDVARSEKRLARLEAALVQPKE
ncbi:ubiquinone biosynthesis accessory factor UbiJ [Aquitalea aquatica]|uniref:Ubiquinone biosynthesis accessory factor UbiJ n=1 Tax=Aquitalea aquatica TaxID=3044273 RepID=A0A838Y576_9NEIS|nr:sterol-binding protein [Aquitalea magnusonii]MBA4709018.1 sterol-binding protein [Aquitalea magnusonii]